LTIYFYIIILILIMFFNAAEIAYVSARRTFFLKKKSKSYVYRMARSIYNKPEIYFSVVLIGTNLMIVLFSILYAKSHSILMTSIVPTLAILFIGEVIPKTITLKFPERLTLIFSLPIKILYILFYPLHIVVKYISEGLLRIFRFRIEPEVLNKAEIEVAMKENVIKGIMKKEEYSILKNVLSLSKMDISEVMVPRIDIVASDINEGIEGVFESFRKRRFSRIPIYKDSIDNIIGIVHIRELLNGNKEGLDKFLKPVKFISENKTCEKALYELLSDINRAAIVIDEYGGTTGFVTVDDIFLGIMGSSIDYDLGFEGALILKGEVKVKSIGIESSEDTVAGYIIQKIGRIPNEGEEIVIDKYKFRILDASDRKIKKVQVFK